MLGWFKAEADRASFSKRLSLEGSAATSAGRTLIVTSRPSRVSRAFQTSPIPPAPRRVITVPAESIAAYFSPWTRYRSFRQRS